MFTPRNRSDWTQLAPEPAFQDGCHSARLSFIGDMRVVIEAVLGVMTTVGYPAKDIFTVRLALEESLVNAIKHGHQNDSTKQVKVRYKISQECVLIEVEDQGDGFDPSQVPDPTAPENLGKPCGRGLFLIHHYMSWVHHNNKGNCITFCKYPTETPVATAASS
jgi:serine/threonine-protein kinase RsbW